MEPSDSHPIDVVDKSKAEYAKVGELRHVQFWPNPFIDASAIG